MITIIGKSLGFVGTKSNVGTLRIILKAPAIRVVAWPGVIVLGIDSHALV